VTIQWFPGHMHRARKQIAAAMPKVDVVIEILDARLPRSSRNPLLTELRGDRPCLRLLSKADLADPRATEAWIARFESEGGGGGGRGRARVAALAITCTDRGIVGGIVAACRRLAPGRGTLLKPVRVLVAGIPNVGKSTLINTIRGRRVAKTGDVPALTKSAQKIEVQEGFVVSDTPGVLWPRLDDQEGARRLAASGAIRDSAMDYPTVALWAAGFLLERYPELLRERYLGPDDPLPATPLEALDAVGRRRGCLMRGGEIDYDRASQLLLRDLRAGRVGRVTFELPDEAEPPTAGG